MTRQFATRKIDQAPCKFTVTSVKIIQGPVILGAQWKLVLGLGPSGAFDQYGSAEAESTEPATAVGVDGSAAAAAGEVEGYGARGPGLGAPGGINQGAPQIRVATLGASCFTPLPVTQAHNIGLGKHYAYNSIIIL